MLGGAVAQGAERGVRQEKYICHLSDQGDLGKGLILASGRREGGETGNDRCLELDRGGRNLEASVYSKMTIGLIRMVVQLFLVGSTSRVLS